MIELNIPGRDVIQIEYLVSDVNGTLALDGQLIEGISRSLRNLSATMQIHLLTANTHGRQDAIDRQLGMTAVRLSPGQESEQKKAYVENLGAGRAVAIGQGANDAGMLAAAAVGICVLSSEGAAVETLLAADIVVPNIQAAFDLLERPLRLVATLRK